MNNTSAASCTAAQGPSTTAAPTTPGYSPSSQEVPYLAKEHFRLIQHLLPEAQGASQYQARTPQEPTPDVNQGAADICRHHLRGHCKIESQCRFAHPDLFQLSRADSTGAQSADTGQKGNEYISPLIMRADLEPYIRDERDNFCPPYNGILPNIMKVVPKGTHIDGLFFISYQDLSLPIPFYDGKFKSRPAKIQLDGIYPEASSQAVAAIIYFLTEETVQAVDLFKPPALAVGGFRPQERAVDPSRPKPKPGLCAIWTNGLNPTAVATIIDAFTKYRVWMAPKAGFNGVFIAKDDSSKQYLGDFLENLRRHEVKIAGPKHPLTAQLWEDRESDQRRSFEPPSYEPPPYEPPPYEPPPYEPLSYSPDFSFFRNPSAAPANSEPASAL